MKRILALVTLGCLCTAAFALNIPTPADKAAPSPQPSHGKLIVHEWGTFTGFVGSDGVHLPFTTTVGGDLPTFVLTRGRQATRDNPTLQWIDFGKGGGALALQRMETPVIYFYTDQPRDVSVKVDFPQGLLTEFYPPVRAMLPAYGDGPREPRLVSDGKTTKSLPGLKTPPRLERSSLDWGAVRIVPQSAAGENADRIPDVSKTPEAAAHYAYARETDAATVQFSDRPGERHDERFLFYRGLGDFSLPVALTAAAGGRFEMNNAAQQPVSFALLLNVSDGLARFSIYRDVAGRQSMTLPNQRVSTTEVGDAIADALVAEGLYEKEARAMVKTWSAQWLGEPGTRLLYIVPRPITDDLLPLKISPAPDETVRVLIGRIDIITPEEETRLQSLLATSTQAQSLAPDDAAYLHTLGRFLTPALQRGAKLRGTRDPYGESNRLRSLYHNTSRSNPLLTTLPQ